MRSPSANGRTPCAPPQLSASVPRLPPSSFCHRRESFSWLHSFGWACWFHLIVVSGLQWDFLSCHPRISNCWFPRLYGSSCAILHWRARCGIAANHALSAHSHWWARRWMRIAEDTVRPVEWCQNPDGSRWMRIFLPWHALSCRWPCWEGRG